MLGVKMIKKYIQEQILNVLSENSNHKEMIDYHNELADEHNEELEKAHFKLQNKNLSNKEFDRLRKKRDAHQEGYMNHISAKNFWKRNEVEKAKELSKRADDFDHDMISKGII
jgi:predicted metal-dependent phosphoesterase TrpH